MELFLTLALLFMVGASSGWILELLFRRFFSAKKWINPGFLIGPYLPLYGFGLVGLFLMCRVPIDFIENEIIREIIRVVVMTLVLTLIEYITGLIFIKGMKVKLWDYSDRFGNIQGIICPLFSLFWMIICALYDFLVDKHVLAITNWFNENITFSFFVGIFFGLIIADMLYSFKVASKIKQFAKQSRIIVKWEEFKEKIAEYNKELKKKVSFILPFKEGNISLSEQFENYLKKIKANKKIDDKKEKKDK